MHIFIYVYVYIMLATCHHCINLAVCPPRPPCPPSCVLRGSTVPPLFSLETHGAVPHRHPDIPAGQGGSAASGHGQERAERLSFLAPAYGPPQVWVEPHFNDLSAGGSPDMHHSLLHLVLRGLCTDRAFPAAHVDVSHHSRVQFQ